MRKSTFYLIIVAVLVAGIVLSCLIGSNWGKTPDIKNWFNGWGQGVKQTTPDENPDENTPDEGGETSNFKYYLEV